MPLHVVVGSGAIGTSTALLLHQRGFKVRVITRRGGGPKSEGIERVAADASSFDRMKELCEGADAVYNCANPPYHRWSTDWPPIANSLLETTKNTGAVLVTMSNLYGYGPQDHPMKETDPLNAIDVKGRIRAAMWEQVLAAIQAGDIRAAEARASDYFGPGVGSASHISEREIYPLLRGKKVRVFGNPDLPHSWTFVPDIAMTLVTLGTEPRALGKAWHVPTNPPMSQRQVFAAMAKIANIKDPVVESYPRWQLKLAGLFSPLLRELEGVRYQFDSPFVVDSTEFQKTFAIPPTPMEEALNATVKWELEDMARLKRG